MRRKLAKGDTSSKIAAWAFAVSVFSMLGVVANALFNYRWQQTQQQTRIEFRCQIPDDSVIEPRPGAYPEAFGKDGGMGDPGPDLSRRPDQYATFPLLMALQVECRVANLGSRKVSLSALSPAVSFGNSIEVDRSWLARLMDEKRQPTALPRLLGEGEEALYTLEVLWPVEGALAKPIRSFLARTGGPNYSLSFLGGTAAPTYFDLGYHLFKLREAGGLAAAWAWRRKHLRVWLETADGKHYEDSLQPPF